STHRDRIHERIQSGANAVVEREFIANTRALIDGLKNTCASYGLGNDGNEFKIITQSFLYKFLNDKFAYEAKKLDANIARAESWEAALSALSADELELLTMQMPADTARLQPEQFLSTLFSQQNESGFAD